MFAYLESSKVQVTISNQFCSFLPENDQAVLSPTLCQTLTSNFYLRTHFIRICKTLEKSGRKMTLFKIF